MPALPTTDGAVDSGRGIQADQLYITHCLKGGSVEQQAGFGLRATSVQSPPLYRFTREFPPYKVPLDMNSQETSPDQTPRRLALVRTPEGQSALVQSSYVMEDTRGRGGNYFSHFLIYDRIAPIDAVRSWGASDWRSSYPEGATVDLDPFRGIPRGQQVDEDALCAFLSASSPPGGADAPLSTSVFPARMEGDPARRRR